MKQEEGLEDLLKRKEISESDAKTNEENVILRAELKTLKRNHKDLDKLLIDQKEVNTRLGTEIKKYQTQIKTLQEGVKALQQDYRSLLELFTERTEELAKSEEDKVILERALTNTKSLIDKANKANAQTQEFLNQIAESENEKLELRKKVMELEERLITNNGAIEYFNEKLPLLESSIGRFQNQIEVLKIENEALKKGDAGSVLLKLQEELKTLKTENKDSKVLAESLRAELNNKEMEVKALRHKLNECEEQRKNSSRSGNDTECNEERYILENRRNQDRELKASKNREEILRKQIEQLKFLVENYEDSNKQLIEYINSLTKTPSPTVIDNQMEELKSELRLKENQLNLATLDNGKLKSDINVLRIEVDKKNVECERNKAELARLAQEVVLLREKLNQDEAIVNSQILGRENEILKLQEELKRIKSVLNNKNKECQDLQNQLKGNEELMESYKVVCDSNEKYKEEIKVLRNENMRLRGIQKQAIDQSLRIEILERDNKNLLLESEKRASQIKDVMEKLKEGYEALKAAAEEKSKREQDFILMQNVIQCIINSYLQFIRKNQSKMY